jgi:uncharacterized membrane protein YozB (DUF420 family)
MDHEVPLRPTVIRTTTNTALAEALTDVQEEGVVVLLALHRVLAVTKVPLVYLSWCETFRQMCQRKS